MNKKILNYISQLALPSKNEKELIELIRDASFSTHDATVIIPNRRHTIQKPLEEPGLKSEVSSEDQGITSDQEPPHKIGKYSIVRLLGKGGAGEVYRVRDPDLNREIALKILLSQKGTEKREIHRFVREAQICAQLQHPGIVAIHEIILDDSFRPYFTMREVHGSTLHLIFKNLHFCSTEEQWGVTDDGWTFKKTLNIIIKICETLSYAHSKGVIHRDIKPGNIMVGDFGEVSVVDWGLAICTKAKEVTVAEHLKEDILDEIVGTPKFMAPEQADGRNYEIDARSEVYSIGCMLYLLLVGKNFYQGDIYKVIQDVSSPFVIPSFPSPLWERIPQELARITKKALEHEPRNRYQTAKELAQELEFWLEGSRSQEKANNLLKKIDEISQQEKDIRITLLQEYSALQTLYQQAKVITPKMWSMWQSYNQNKIRIRACAHQKEKCMLNALIYAPHMQSIHKQIIETESERYKKFWIRGDNESLLQIERKVIIHLQQLPHQETLYWENFKKRQQDSVNQQRREKGSFIGCQYQLQTIFETLQENPYLVLYGEAGIGKTRLALEIAARWRDAHSVNSYFCNLQLCTTLTEAYHIIATTLGISISTPDLFKEICSSFQNRSAVLIFDNIDNIQDDFVRMLSVLETVGPDIRSLITTQKNTHIPAQYCKKMPPLSIFASLELFLAKSRRYNPNLQFLEENRTYYLDIVHHLEGVPLAIEIFAAKLSVISLHELHEHIRKSAFITEETGLQKTLNWSWGLLSSSTQSILKQCSLFQDGFFLEAAIGILMSDKGDSVYIIDQLDILLQTQFIRKQTNKGKTRYYLLPAVSRFVHSRIEKDLRDTKIRFAEYFAQKYAPTFQKEDNHVYWQIRSIEKSNLIAAIRYGRITDAQVCLESILEVLYFQYEYRLGLQLLDLFLSRLTVQEQISHHFYTERVSLLFRLDKAEQANEYVPQIEHYIKTGASKIYLAHWYYVQAKKMVSQKDLSKTISYLKQALSLFQDKKRIGQIIEISIELCKYHRERNQFTIALDYILRAQSLAEKGPTQFLVRVYMQIGIFYKEQSNFHTALDYYQKAQVHMQLFPNESHLATILFNVGNIYRTLGRFSEALHLYHQSMHIEVRLGNRLSIIKIQNSIGLSYMNNGQYTKALEILHKCYFSAEKAKKPFLTSVISGNIGDAYFECKEYELAIEKYKESLILFQELNRKTGIAIMTGNLCDIYLELGNLPLANQYLQQALRLEQELTPLGRGFIFGLCGQFHGKNNNPTLAETYFSKGEHLLHDSPQNLFHLFEKKVQYYHNQNNEVGKSETVKKMFEIIENLENEAQIFKRSKLDALLRTLSYSQKKI